MKSLTAVAPLVLALLVAGCGENRSTVTPTAPTLIPTRAETSPAETPERWNLTMTVSSITGPRVNCFAPIGAGIVGTPVRDQIMTINRAAESISFSVPDPWWYETPTTSYVGVVVGEDFSAAAPGSYGGWVTCAGTRTDLVWTGHVSGRFSPPGYSLTATEVWSYKFSTGDEVTVHIDWTATRQD